MKGNKTFMFIASAIWIHITQYICQKGNDVLPVDEDIGEREKERRGLEEEKQDEQEE